ncbi:M20 family metallopeptidase [Salsuginibacillus kocurii]|uniref:M20 family metallopeptidase n=1 Tax=Salsuginibacillus kocurii TaxID=427078 RepID=UPI00036693B2|nr:M20 family metallopeptidase [Salsuginibacillus kocurii]
MEDRLYQLLDDSYEEMVEIRRYLHQHPELSFEEVETPKYIASFHRELGHEVREQVGSRGVVATLKGGKEGPTVALRADFDALPIQDEKDVPYRSKVEGKMHACGHDGHTATLLVLAKAINRLKDEWPGTVVFIHQHAEEFAPGGAIEMVEDGCLAGVDVVFGTHLWATEPTGVLQVKSGPMMAASDRFEITVHGKGGHGAMPHLTNDAVLTASQLVVNLQSIVSRKVDPQMPAVLSIGSFVAENAFNVIADSAYLMGTVRTFDEEARNQIEEEMNTIVNNTCEMAGATAEFNYLRGYPAVVNHKEETEFIQKEATSVPGVTRIEEREAVMGGEDFAYYLQNVKGTFFFTGAQAPSVQEPYPHHHPKFDIDETAMLIAAKTLGKAALCYEN